MTRRLFFLAAFLNFFDAGATLFHVATGGTELNPIMGALLHHGAGWFLLAKFLGVPVALAVLYSHRAQIALLGVCVVYGLVAFGHLTLLFSS